MRAGARGAKTGVRDRRGLLDLGSDRFSRWKSHSHVRGSKLGQIRNLKSRSGGEGAGADCPALPVWNPEPPGPLLWVPCAGCRPFPIWPGFQGPFLPLSSPQSPPGHIPPPPTTTSQDHPGHFQRTCSLTSPVRPGSKMLFPSASV